MSTKVPTDGAPSKPFENIALSLSGGGYRAAGFHLGALDLLDALGLLERVSMLSTVSGGTIAGVCYAAHAARRDDYSRFYERLYGTLLRVNVIKGALDGLGAKGEGRLSPSLIRAAAKVYADELFGDATFESLSGADAGGPGELVFNATEFRRGLAFRFTKSRSEKALVGNRYFPVDGRVAAQIRLSDIVAASSCFPGVFEPIRFPDDFRWADGLERVREMLGEPYTQDGDAGEESRHVCVPLMDGGIYDNQGLESITLAGDRAGAEIGTIIISDTNQRNDAMLNSAGRQRGRGPSVGTLTLLLRLLFALSVGTALAVAGKFIDVVARADASVASFVGGRTAEFVFLYAMPFTLAASVALLLWRLRGLTARAEHVSMYGTTFPVWEVARRLSLHDLIDVVSSRAESLMAMSGSVFLKRVRDQNLRAIARDTKYKDKVMFNVLYEMTLAQNFLIGRDARMEPSEALVGLARRAEKIDTKLWVKDEEELKDLVACGHATTCFNLIKYLWKSHRDAIVNRDPRVYPVYERAVGIWERLKADPRALLNRERRGGQ